MGIIKKKKVSLLAGYKAHLVHLSPRAVEQLERLSVMQSKTRAALCRELLQKALEREIDIMSVEVRR